jgi:hypothetical protein
MSTLRTASPVTANSLKLRVAGISATHFFWPAALSFAKTSSTLARSRSSKDKPNKNKPKSTDKEVENVVPINAHKGSNIFALSPFR